jgi:isocitrate dehydrogenase (NAD+)
MPGEEKTMKKKVTLIPGDGTGPEVAAAMKKCVDATGVEIEWEELNVEWGDSLGNQGGIPRYLIDSIEKNRVAIKGPITTPIGRGFRSLNVTLRQLFDLYACVRPCKTLEGARTPYRNIDLVVIRENTEDLYAGFEFREYDPATLEFIAYLKDRHAMTIPEDASIGLKPISKRGSERICRFAFNYAREKNRKSVTAVHKANIMKFTDGLFGRVAQSIAKDYPELPFREVLIDNLCMQLVMRPQQFDVLVLPNLYGDIVSDLCAGLIGGLGMAPGGNIGHDMAIFEATHGSAPQYAGLNKVNPTALILSGVMMLEYLEEKRAAKLLFEAVANVIREGRFVTYDFKERRDDPTAVGTSRMAEAIVEEIKRLMQHP